VPLRQYLYFYSASLDKGWTNRNAHKRQAPLKVSCTHCRSPVGDESEHMWLAFCPLFGFSKEETPGGVPKAFQHSCHLFYQQRCIDIPDKKEKWEGLRKTSRRWTSVQEEEEKRLKHKEDSRKQHQRDVNKRIFKCG